MLGVCCLHMRDVFATFAKLALTNLFGATDIYARLKAVLPDLHPILRSYSYAIGKYAMKIKCSKIFLASSLVALVNICHGASVTGTVTTVAATTNNADGIDKAIAVIQPSSTAQGDPSCQAFGFVGYTKNLTDPGAKAQFTLLLSAKINATQVFVAYHVTNQQCVFDAVYLNGAQ